MKELCKGISVMNCFAAGKVKIVENPMDAVGKCKGCIIVAKSPNPLIVLLLREASGVITQSGGMTCHVALVCMENEKPAIVGASEIFSVVHDGMNIAFIGRDKEGIVYAVD